MTTIGRFTGPVAWPLLLTALFLVGTATAAAQTIFKPGDQVEASPMALKDDKYYKPCTVASVDRSGGVYTLNCSGTEYAVPSAYVRAPKAKVADVTTATVAPPVGNVGQFKVGDRVLASVSGLKGEKNYRPCTVKSGLKDNAYGLECDPHNGQPFMSFSVIPEWIKAWPDATPAPEIGCPFNKSYGKVNNKAPASAGLFKNVIFAHQNSTQDFYDFGLTFLEFDMGRVFKNRQISVYRRDVDTAPVGTTIHELKAKELICQKSSTITKRWVREIGYACYKDEVGEWTCKNGAPKYLEQTSIPNK
jgi:hypothetical protein